MKKPEIRCDNCGMVYRTRYHPGLVGLLFLTGLIMIGYAFVGLVFWAAGLLYWSRRRTKCTECGAKDGNRQRPWVVPQGWEPLESRNSDLLWG
ncbi:MAG: hypothetical protein V3T99_01950 [Nitrososphaerales archaeon]